MSVKCSEIIKYMEEYAPSSLSESWDNVGLMLGDENSEVKKILTALDVNDDVIDEAVENNIDLIITHHPFIFKPIKNITCSTPLGKRIFKLIKNNISVFSAHTNLDIAKFGTNDTFAYLLNLKNVDNLCNPVNETEGLGKVGELESEMKFREFINIVKKVLNIDKIVISGNLDKTIKKAGIGTGKCSGFEYMKLAKEKGCDVYITGDVGYHDAQNAVDLELCLIDATHYLSEVLIIPVICDYLNKISIKNNLDFKCFTSKVNGQVLNII